MSSIIGSWRLISLQVKQNEKILHPFGENVRGLVIYNENGYMSGMISGENRPNVTSPASAGLSESERIGIAKNFIAYAGKYKTENGRVIHSVEVSFIPNLMDESNHSSNYTIDGNIMIVTSNNGEGSSISLLWGKVD